MRPDPAAPQSLIGLPGASTDTAALLRRAAELAAGFLADVGDRPVHATATRAELLAGLGGALP